MDRAERYFRDALGRRPDYGEAANNLALVLVSRGQTDAAVALLQGVLKRTPEYEAAYVTLAKIHFSAGRSKEGIAVLEQLLQRNPKHAVARRTAPAMEGPVGACIHSARTIPGNGFRTNRHVGCGAGATSSAISLRALRALRSIVVTRRRDSGAFHRPRRGTQRPLRPQRNPCTKKLTKGSTPFTVQAANDSKRYS